MSLAEKRRRAVDRAEKKLRTFWLSSPKVKERLSRQLEAAKAKLRSTKENPSAVIPRNKWIKGSVKVDSHGVVKFKTTATRKPARKRRATKRRR